ncbi:MAG: alpha-glucosidase C-terminal domain-containing protein [Ignavibacteriaceae bacterium]|nr:alpha-glucosidase C-terminal domain-containing protein [Ignavibacteriaceae bacterium]
MKKFYNVLSALSKILLFVLLVHCCKDNVVNTPQVPAVSSIDVKNIIMYEINIRAFSSEGTFQGIIDRLDSIKALSINTIWLMPIHPIGKINTVNSPYCVKNYTEVNPEFGNLDNFKTLIQEAHNRGIKVIIDWVANHTSWDNPWIQNKSWYTQDGSGNIIHPAGTNWQDVADLNYDNADMKAEMIKSMKYWVIDVGVDGFRCDAADFVPYEFWKQAIEELSKIEGKSLIFLAEGSRTDHFTAGFQMNYSWDFYSTIKNVFKNGYAANYLFSTHSAEYQNIPSDKHKLRFTTNHDESAWDATPITIFNGKKGALAASVITIYLGGVPLIYSSQEVGVSSTISFFTRQPINWSLNPDMLAEYKKLLALYSNSDVLKRGSIEKFEAVNVLAFKKTYQQKEVLVLVNVRNSSSTFTTPASLANTTWKNVFDSSSVNIANTIQFEPYDYLILTK